LHFNDFFKLTHEPQTQDANQFNVLCRFSSCLLHYYIFAIISGAHLLHQERDFAVSITHIYTVNLTKRLVVVL